MSNSKVLVVVVLMLTAVSCGFVYAQNQVPTVGTISPSSGLAPAGQWKPFTCTYSDGNGYTHLSNVYCLISTGVIPGGAAFFYYNQNTNLFYGVDNVNRTLSVTGSPGSAGRSSAIVKLPVSDKPGE